jgi:hypothetical protein
MQIFAVKFITNSVKFITMLHLGRAGAEGIRLPSTRFGDFDEMPQQATHHAAARKVGKKHQPPVSNDQFLQKIHNKFTP